MISRRKRTVYQRMKRTIRYFYLRLLRIKTTPHSLALGLAVGVFVGFLPTLPIQSIWAVGLCFLIGGSKLAAMLGTWVSNPITFVPMLVLNAHIGDMLLPGLNVSPSFADINVHNMFSMGLDLITSMFVGGLALGVPAAFFTYVFTLRAARIARRRRLERARHRIALEHHEQPT
ncbi:DUF2062 domain-containing protein [Desulfovibrio inopinatus]|uniref:DUF2062 domain-containing protein n=1 Tax=Desulfovibrio inopinatus TaxID=102109 RepID=UPI00040DC26E|nr:DUF2062 domain-containing protein [Desulfovibrio inopinatus]